MVVDEDGLRKRLPVNFYMPFEGSPYPVQMVVGDVVFIRNKKVDYIGEIPDWEVIDVTQADIDGINNLLDPVNQSMLGMVLRGLYRK